MRSPAQMDIIQIEITNACLHRCSNCTRFCGHHKKPFFMDLDIFAKAVDSLADYPGMVGIMGGEPTIHPHFAEIAKRIADKRKPDPKVFLPLKEPVKDFAAYRHSYLAAHSHKVGLWTSLGDKYYENFELIQDVFGYQCVNDHQNPGLHQALMITRSELGIPDAEWIQMRDKCWIQNLWSASITPKGAFFCEIAAAMDALFDGPGGWHVEPGWWRRTPEDFKDQLHWCELCSAALKVPGFQANAEKDIVSPALLERLKAIGSPKIGHGAFSVFDVKHYDSSKYAGNTKNGLSYLPDGNVTLRVAKTNRTIFPRALSIQPKEEAVRGIAPFTDWCAVAGRPADVPANLEEEFKSAIFNTGCAYYHIPGHRGESELSFDEIAGKATIFIFNRRASAVDGQTGLAFGPALISRWSRNKLIPLPAFPQFIALDTQTKLNPCPPQSSCAGKTASTPKCADREAELIARLIRSQFQHLRVMYPCIALYGAGAHTKWLLEFLESDGMYPDRMSRIKMILDGKANGSDLRGIRTVQPSASAVKGIDAIILSTDCHQTAMRAQIASIPGLPSIPVVDLYEGAIGPFRKPTAWESPS